MVDFYGKKLFFINFMHLCINFAFKFLHFLTNFNLNIEHNRSIFCYCQGLEAKGKVGIKF